jgi:hypothetical protein
LRGLDLNQRPLGYEPLENELAAQAAVLRHLDLSAHDERDRFERFAALKELLIR